MRIEAAFPQLSPPPSLARLTATLECDGRPIDTMVSGVVFEQPAVVQSGPQLRFRDNYLTLNGRPTFLFGSDTYALIYKAACENPWTWAEELAAARDVGMNLYENLQYQNPGHKMADDDWRSFRAVAQLTQASGQVFMPGMLVGHNVAIGDAAVKEESQLCQEYAQQLGHTPGLLWYINGDYQMEPGRNPKDVKELWNRWLAAEYGTTERLREAWGAAAAKAELGKLDFPPPNTARWDDAAAVDQSRFLNGLLRRWNEAHVAAVRSHDRQHPITSEYYCFPYASIDMLLSIDGQDVANTGYFDKPGDDLEKLPLRLRWNDMRARGKGLSLGEYGVKTHPAWKVAAGAEDYHIVRSEDQQKQLFLAVAHYGLGLGACKVQNWCLRDDPTWVFPWGIFYPNQLIAKDVAYAHRNQSLVWRFFQPRYRPEAVAVGIANQLRQGNSDFLGAAVAHRTFAGVFGLHYDFAAIDDDHLDRLPQQTAAMILPCPLAMHDEAFAKLSAWVRSGGRLLVTGDCTHDVHRRRTRTDRLKELAGAEWVSAVGVAGTRTSCPETRAEFPGLGIAPTPLRPCIRIKPVGAEVLGSTAAGEPVLVRHRLGGGIVYFLADPIEMADDKPAAEFRRQLYAAFLSAAGQGTGGRLAPQAVAPDEPWLHVMNQPTAQGSVHVVYNTKTEEGTATVELSTRAGRVRLDTRSGWPALAAATDKGRVVAVNAYGNASVEASSVMRGAGLKALLSLDGEDLRTSQAILVAPFEPGRVELPDRAGSAVALVGDFRDGRWATLERIALEAGRRKVDIDADRATCLILVCPVADEVRWAARLTQAMLRPDQIAGY